MTADITARNTHPMMVVAAIAVTLLSLTGIAAIMGWIPSSTGNPASLTHSQPAPIPPASAAQAVNVTAAPAPPAVAEPVPATPRPAKVATRHELPTTNGKSGNGIAHPEQSHAPGRHDEPAQVATAFPPPPAVPAAGPESARAKPQCFDCGVIESVHQIEKKGEGSGLGAAAGGVLGGILGHQVGAGRGRDIMTVVGAVGGAVAGHQVEKNSKKTVTYEITVRFEDGTTRTMQQAVEPAWRIGDRVRIINSEIIPDR